MLVIIVNIDFANFKTRENKYLYINVLCNHNSRLTVVLRLGIVVLWNRSL